MPSALEVYAPAFAEGRGRVAMRAGRLKLVRDLDGEDDDVAESGVTALGTAQHLEDTSDFSSGVICDLDYGTWLNHMRVLVSGLVDASRLQVLLHILNA